MAIIAFDFDETLSTSRLQVLAKKLRKEKNELWIITARTDNDFNKDYLRPILKSLFIPECNVIYCSHNPKLEMIKMVNPDIYIDNITDEFEDILNHTNTIPLLWLNQ